MMATTPPTTVDDLWGVYSFGTNDTWVAGVNATIQHFTGTWTTTPSPATHTLFMFWGATNNDIWLVGRSCDAVRWQGSSWAATSIPGCSGNQDLLSINGSSASNVWATGFSGAIAQYTGSWTTHSFSNDDYWDSWVVDASDVTIVGTLGAIVHWNGSIMAAETSGVSVTLAAITSPATGEYWVVGGSGTILHKVGTAGWTTVASPTTMFLYDVLAVSPTDIWAVGSGGVILHGDGTSWVQVQSPTTNTLRSLAAIPGGGIVAVGTAATMLSHP
jgi:hypothetical protein